MKSSTSRAFLEHACWPNARTMKTRRYPGAIAPEIEDMLKMIGRIMRTDSQPSEADIKSKVVPLTELYGRDDALLLDYRTKSGYRIQLQDAQAFYVLVTAPGTVKKDLSRVEAFVVETAAAVLAPPVQYLPKPIVHVSSADIGESKLGYMQYGPRESIVPEDWYTQISWWSDGKQILFEIENTEKADLDKERGTPHIQMGPRPPKVFASRKGSGK